MGYVVFLHKPIAS